ncbi:zinc-dependent alcohol dehydrogenase [Kineosporia succinea]|uniref:Threonine dehydrogenase-like Zn-dependent dehydrogenase n=1 Tax=Kineosporia succinea TaxID=84632 RepID=A0ABT9P2K6_9ACTN|nr:zinc-binding dehydrogenase [Kineosporia succinea]MDP9826916.1 threonine dehydrogenase-like Zn-dependent dehydrogenase [Kineosporia succinea]
MAEPEAPTTGQVVLRTTSGGICGSDLGFFRGATTPEGTLKESMFGEPGFPLHEITGQVVASAHPDHEVGDQVVGWATRTDGVAEYVTTSGDQVAGYRSTLKPEIAVLLQPLACVLHAVEQLGDVTGKNVAVLGLGPIGLLFAHVLRARGAGRITGVDRVRRDEMATRFGVDEVVWASSDRWARDAILEPEVVVECIGHQAGTLNDAIRVAAYGGQIYYFGVADEAAQSVNLRQLQRKNLTLYTGLTRDRRRMLGEAGRYLAEHPGLETGYVTDVIHVVEIEAAFRRALDPAPAQGKVVVRMP